MSWFSPVPDPAEMDVGEMPIVRSREATAVSLTASTLPFTVFPAESRPL